MKQLIILTLAFLFLSCSKDDEAVEQMEITSFTVISNNIGDQAMVRVKAETLNAYEYVRLSARFTVNGTEREIDLQREGQNLFSNYSTVYTENVVPEGMYTVRLFADVGNGFVQTTLSSSMEIEYSEIDNPTSLTLDVSSAVEQTSAEVTIEYANALLGSLLRVRVFDSSSTVLSVADYELSEEGNIILSLTDLTPGETYLVRITGVPTANDYPDLLEEYSFQTETSAPGTLAASLSQAFNIVPNSARTTITYVNTTGSAVNATILTLGSDSGEQSFVISLPETSFDDMEIYVGDLHPDESVEISIVVDGSTLDATVFSTPLVSYTSVNLALEGGHPLTPNMNSANVAGLYFTANGETNAQQVKFRFKSNNDLVEIWDVILILGQPGNNLSVGSESSWESIGGGWYEVSLMIDTPIASMGNSILGFVSTKNYSFSETVTFQFSMIVIDQQGTQIGNGTEETVSVN